jgi:hypothetical protein
MPDPGFVQSGHVSRAKRARIPRTLATGMLRATAHREQIH